MILFLLLLPCSAVYPVPIATSPTPIHLTIDGTLAVNGTEVGISPNSDCGSILELATFVSHFVALGNEYPAKSVFVIPTRPDWTLDPAKPTVVCVDKIPVGHLQFFLRPNISFHGSASIQIPLRLFANPGWTVELPRIACTQCDPTAVQYMSLALKEGVVGKPPCSGPREEDNVFWKVTDEKSKAMNPFPFRIRAVTATPDHLMGTPVRISDAETEKSDLNNFEIFAWTFSRQKFSVASQAKLIKEKLYLCVYTEPGGDGQYMGSVEFHLSQEDTQGLVFFLVFLGVVFPLLCIVTLLLHCYRLKRHRQFVSSVQHYVQRIALEQEMLDRRP